MSSGYLGLPKRTEAEVREAMARGVKSEAVMTPVAVKFCKDCRFHHVNTFDRIFFMSRFAVCTNRATKLSTDYGLVTGSADYESCALARSRHWPCGPSAKLFEPR